MRGKAKFIKAHLDTAKEYDNDIHDVSNCLLCIITSKYANNPLSPCKYCTMSSIIMKAECLDMKTMNVINYSREHYISERNIWRAKFHRRFAKYLKTVDANTFMDKVIDGTIYDEAIKVDVTVYNEYKKSKL